jgi:hypothetical protein
MLRDQDVYEEDELSTIDGTYSEDGTEIFFASGYSAQQVAKLRHESAGGTIYVNTVSRKIIREDLSLATNAPVHYAVADSPVYTLIRDKKGDVVRAYWPDLGS